MPIKPNVFLVGAGPGDPGLITARGAELLRRADVVLYDYQANPALLNLTRPECERIAVGGPAQDPMNPQPKPIELLLEKAHTGGVVVQLMNGDPFIFGRGAEECEALLSAGVLFEVVPGVIEGLAAPEYAGVPLTARKLSASVTFISERMQDGVPDGLDWPALARVKGTLAIELRLDRLRDICGQLIEGGLDAATPAAVIARAVSPSQRSLLSTVHEAASAAEQAGLGSPVLAVIGPVAQYHQRLNWFETRPLFGRRMAITRDPAGNAALAERLLELGCEPLPIPLIQIIPPTIPRYLKEAVQRLEHYDWIAFTSVHAVQNFMECLRENGLDSRALGGVKIAAVGAVTAASLTAWGITTDVRPEKRMTSAELARRICEGADVRGRSVLFPCADIARDDLPNALRDAGAHVDCVVAYQTRAHRPDNFNEVTDAMLRGEIDAVLFASSSAAMAFADFAGASRFPQIAQHTLFAVIGPSTKDALELLGVKNILQHPEDYSIDGLLTVLCEHFTKKPAQPEPPSSESPDSQSWA
ncbi:uroporphyrinogen-III C-methyltransferase [Candidatus Sumerlaeota bacterium]|nr:uroporphyrinogen-III C-methyltransferase [Candidatus Sumerlaeota bacterium]